MKLTRRDEMFIKKDTIKFIEERDHYIRANLKKADDLTQFDFKKIAERAGVSLDAVLDDAKVYKFDLKHHVPKM